MNPQMNDAMNILIANIKKDYFEWTTGCAAAAGRCILNETNKMMIERFNDNLTYKVGTKYMRNPAMD